MRQRHLNEIDGQPTTALLIWRAARLRCPACGGRGILESWFKLRPRCDQCEFVFEREHDYFTGSMLLNLIVAECAFALGVVIAIVATWPSPPWKWIFYCGIAFMTVAPFVFFPLSKTLWLAFDLIFRPRGSVTAAEGKGE